MEKLISMTDFVLDHKNEKGFKSEYSRQLYYFNIYKSYANFLKQKLELFMFIPCKLVNGVWVVLEEPGSAPIYTHSEKYLSEYKEAKDRVLFEGFEKSIGNDKAITNYGGAIIRLHQNNCFSLNGKQIFTIEDLVKYSLELTKTVQKQIGLWKL